MGSLAVISQGAFVAHNGGPKRHAPEDWMVWHFTRLEYLDEIADDGELTCDDKVTPRIASVADPSIKERRRQILVRADGYPEGRAVSEHVPFYIAAKSPMLFAVTKRSPHSVVRNLIFFGIRLRDLDHSGLDWVASDSNAAAAIAQFTSELRTLGDFVDYDLLIDKWWSSTPDDPHRASRRAAEVLVHRSVPLDLMSVVVATNDETMQQARDTLADRGYTHPKFIISSDFAY